MVANTKLGRVEQETMAPIPRNSREPPKVLSEVEGFYGDVHGSPPKNRKLTLDPQMEPFDPTFPRGPLLGGHNCWSEPSVEGLHVRGPNYMTDRHKIQSKHVAFNLLNVDVFQTATPNSEGSSNLFRSYATHPHSYVHRALEHGEQRYLVVIHFQHSTYHMAATWALDQNVLNEDTAFARLWDDFLNQGDEFRKARFKIMPRVVEGSWVVRNACGTKPALLATKLTHTFNRTPSYLEIECDTTSSYLAASLAQLCIGYASSLTIDLAFMIEGRAPCELPERIFGILRLSRPNLLKARKETPREFLSSPPAAYLFPSRGSHDSLESGLRFRTSSDSRVDRAHGSNRNRAGSGIEHSRHMTIGAEVEMDSRSESSDSIYFDAEDPLAELFEIFG